MFINAAYFNEDRTGTSDKLGRRHRERNYQLCNALDLTRIDVVLSKMIVDGLHPELARIYKTQAGALLAVLRSENNRNFNK